jgi:hypothetical protein
MGGGLMQLVAYGAQDVYLTGNPQITFFKVVYRRHTNFSMECIQQTINGTSVVGPNPTNGDVTLSRNGDLVYKVYVRSDTPGIINGSRIVNQVNLEIGGQLIDRHQEEWMHVWNELSTPESKAIGLKSMQGAVGTTGAGGVVSVNVPLLFWFCRNPGLALPLIALQYHEVKLKFTWGITANVGLTPACQVWADYIYLDTDERRRFAQVSHEYLIEQVQRQAIQGNTTLQKLNFNHPVKELIWTTPAQNDASNLTVRLTLNGHDRFANQRPEYFQLRQPFDHHTAVPSQNLPGAAGTGRLEQGSLGDMIVRAGMAGRLAANTGAQGNPDTAHTTGLMSVHTSTIPALAANSVVGNGTADGNFTPAAATPTQVTPGALLYLFLSADLNPSLTIGDIVKVTVRGIASLSADANVVSSVVTTVTERVDGGGGAAVAHTIQGVANTMLRFSSSLVPTGQDMGANNVNFVITSIVRLNAAGCRTSQKVDKINCYSFALKPEEHQPSGTCNFSRIDTAHLVFAAAPNPGPNRNIYAVNYNVLRIMSGMGGLAYSN